MNPAGVVFVCLFVAVTMCLLRQQVIRKHAHTHFLTTVQRGRATPARSTGNRKSKPARPLLVLLLLYCRLVYLECIPQDVVSQPASPDHTMHSYFRPTLLYLLLYSLVKRLTEHRILPLLLYQYLQTQTNIYTHIYMYISKRPKGRNTCKTHAPHTHATHT